MVKPYSQRHRSAQADQAALNRRSFLKRTLTASAAGLLAPQGLLAASSPSRKSTTARLNVACVGIGNRGADVVRGLHKTGLANIVALCDTQLGAKHTLGVLDDFPKAEQFRDFRKMFDRMTRHIDAVAVSTPDHSHFAVTMLAMSLGKPVYVEKPMAHTFRQVELMMAAERKYKVACQMGNQGHSEANYFQFKAWTDAGLIKNISRVTTFMNQPRRWHGWQIADFLPAQPVPEEFDWDCWLATARQHAFNRGYLNGDWRAWYDFGSGAIGDWGAHLIDTAHEFLRLRLPTEVNPIFAEGHNDFIFPQASTVVFKFPQRRTLPPVDWTWYDGTGNPPTADEGYNAWVAERSGNEGQPKVGRIIHGEGITFAGGSHGATLKVLNAAQADLGPLPEVPESPSNHFANFLRACRGEEQCRSNFAVAGPLCQTMILGTIAQRVNAKLTFDPATRTVTNHTLADQLLDGAPPRPEWEQFYRL